MVEVLVFLYMEDSELSLIRRYMLQASLFVSLIVASPLIWNNMENLDCFFIGKSEQFQVPKSLSFTFRIFMQVFAMPETALGLFPDAGSSYFLSRLPRFYGYHLSPFFIQLKYMQPCAVHRHVLLCSFQITMCIIDFQQLCVLCQ